MPMVCWRVHHPRHHRGSAHDGSHADRVSHRYHQVPGLHWSALPRRFVQRRGEQDPALVVRGRFPGYLGPRTAPWVRRAHCATDHRT
jgi:hypothetical protein